MTEVSAFIMHATPTVQHLPLNWVPGENTKHLATSVREHMQCLKKKRKKKEKGEEKKKTLASLLPAL